MQVWAGAAGSGKTQRVLERIEAAIREGRSREVRLVVPTASMAQHLLHTLARRGLTAPAQRVQTIADFVAGLTPSARTPGPALEAWLADEAVQAAAPPEFAAADTPGLRSKLLALMHEFWAAGADSGAARRFARTPAQRAFAAVFQEYELLLKKLGYTAQRTREAAAAMEKADLAPLRELYFDGFPLFSPAEQELLRAADRRVDELTATLPAAVPSPFPNAKVTSLGESRRRRPRREIAACNTPRHEVEEIARRIRAEERPCQQIGVIVRSQDVYAHLIQQVFERARIPYRMRLPRPLAHHGAVRFLSGLLRAIEKKFPAEETLALLKSPFSRPGLRAGVDAYEFQARSRLPGDGLAFLKERAGGYSRIAAYLDKLAILEPWAEEELAPAVWAARCRELSAEHLRRPEAGDGLRFERLLEMRALARALPLFDEAAEEAAELAELRSGGEIPLADYLDVLGHVLRHTFLRTPDQRRDVVHVLTVYEARQWELPVVFVCGLAEELFPVHHAADAFFPEPDRARLKLNLVNLRTLDERQEEERKLFEIASTRATETLLLSYPRFNEQGNPYLRSLLLPDGGEDDPRPPKVQIREPAAALTPRPAELTSAESLGLIFARHEGFSPTALESYLQCPYQFFAGKTLRLQEPPPRPEARVDPLLLGGIVHSVIAQWSRDRNRPIQEVLDEVFSEVCRENNIPAGFQTEVVRYNLEADLERFAAESWAGGIEGALKQGTEEKFEFVVDAGEEPFTIRGRIDRYYVLEDGLGFVVDYKYSASEKVRKLPKEHFEYAKLQGHLYLLALERAEGLIPAGVRFWGLKKQTAMAGWVNEDRLPEQYRHEKDELLSDGRFHRRLAEAEALVGEKVAEIRAGRIAVDPRDKDVCRSYCAFRDLCRIEL